MVKFIPQAFKYKVARILGNTLFKLMTIGHFNVLDKKLLWLFIKLQDFDKAERIISDHGNELYYLRFLEKKSDKNHRTVCVFTPETLHFLNEYADDMKNVAEK